jgi:hypothetical protein
MEDVAKLFPVATKHMDMDDSPLVIPIWIRLPILPKIILSQSMDQIVTNETGQH